MVYWEVYERFQGYFLVGGKGLRRGVEGRGLFLQEYVLGEEKFNEKSAGIF